MKKADILLQKFKRHTVITEGLIEDITKNQFVRFVLRVLGYDLKKLQKALTHKDGMSSLPAIVVKILTRKGLL